MGDACYFYPRITRTLGDTTLMMAAISCPETLRLALASPTALAWQEASADRLPHTVKNYLPDGLTAPQALALHQLFLDQAETDAPPARILARLRSVAQSLDSLPAASWADAAPAVTLCCDCVMRAL